MDPIRQHLLAGLESELGVCIPIHNEAAIIRYKEDDIWIEFAENSALINIHCAIDSTLLESRLTVRQIKTLLRLNGRHDLMCGGWIGAHEQTHTLRVFLAIPWEFAYPEIVLEAIHNISPIKTKIREKLAL